MGVATDEPSRKRQRLSLKANRQKKEETTTAPKIEDNDNSASKQSPKKSAGSSSIDTIETSCSYTTEKSGSSTTDKSGSSTTDKSGSSTTEKSGSSTTVKSGSSITEKSSSSTTVRSGSSTTLTTGSSWSSVSNATTYSSSGEETLVPAVASLENLGNTCFMNSVLQVLRFTPGFLDNLATLYQDIAASEKVKRKNSSTGDVEVDANAGSADEDNVKICWKIVKNMFRVYRDQSALEERYEEVASDDVMSMAVRPCKVLSAIRDMNPMYEGHMQHDAQEFLRCLQCYFQDAEKEVQKFYTQLPTKLSPKPMNHIMQRLLNIVQIIDKNMGMKASGMESDTVLEVGGETPEAEKVKVKLFPKPEEETRTAKSPSKVHLVPHEADTAGVVDKLIGEASLPSASLEHHSEDQGKKEDGTSEVIGDKPESVNNNCAAGKRKQKKADVSKHFEKGKKKDQKRPRKETSKELIIEDTSEKFNGKGIKTYGASKKRLGMRGAVVRKTSEELFDEIQEQFDDIKSDSDCKGKENEAARAINRTDPGQNADVNADMKKDVATKDGSNKWKSEKEVIDAGKLIGPLTKLNSFQNAFSAFVNGTHVKVEDDSDSDNGDIVAEKKRAKLLHESPRRSPRKTKSEMVRPSPGKAPVSKLAFVSNSESTVQSVKSKLDFSQPPYRSLSLKRTAENCSQNASVFSENKTCSDAVNNSENTEDVEMDDSDSKIANENVSHCNDKRDKQHLNNFSLTSSQSLLPVVILENCDYVLRENGMSVSAAYASQCLTPRKEGPREDSNNYLKQRTPQLPTEIHDEVEFKKALEEMFNSPVKSRSKYDMVERNFQGMMMLRTRCSTCECARERQEEFHDISVPVRVDSGDSDTEEDMCSPGSETPRSCCSLLDLIEASTEVEKLVKDNKYFCEECQSYTEAERSIHYDILPNILTLHLKRFCADPNNPSSLIKINDRVEIPQTLPCLRYKCSPACLRPDHGYKLYGIVTHSGASLTSGHYLAYVRALPKTDRTLPLYPDIKLEPNIEREKDATKTTDKFPMTRKKAGVTTKLPARFTDNVIANTKVKAFENIAPKKKVDLVDSLLPARAFSTEWFECDDETIRVFDQEDFLKLLSGDSGALLGTPYLLFYHKATLC